MTAIDFKIGVAADKKSAKLSIRADGKQVVWLMLGASDVEALIAQLSIARADMLPEVPQTVPEKEVMNVYHPAVELLRSPLTEDIQLMFRHPGLGWLSFHLPDEEIQKMEQQWSMNKNFAPPRRPVN